MKDAYAAKESGELPLKHFTLLKTVSVLQRERLIRSPLSKEAHRLIREVENAPPAKLRYLSWAFFGTNQPEHPIHSLPTQMISRIWDVLETRRLEVLEPVGQSQRQSGDVVTTVKRRAAGVDRALPATA